MAAPKDTPHSVAAEVARSATASVNVALPATIVSYDATTQRAVVKIVQSFRRKDHAKRGTAEEIVAYRPPTIPGVPVAWWGGGGFSFTCPLAPGDSGLLVFVDRSMDEWLASGADEVEPADTRRHDLTDAVFFPGLRSFAAAVAAEGVSSTAATLKGAEVVVVSPDIKLGSAAASDFVALASLVLTELDALRAELLLHTHATGIGPTGPAIGIGATSNAVAATKVKAE